MKIELHPLIVMSFAKACIYRFACYEAHAINELINEHRYKKSFWTRKPLYNSYTETLEAVKELEEYHYRQWYNYKQKTLYAHAKAAAENGVKSIQLDESECYAISFFVVKDERDIFASADGR